MPLLAVRRTCQQALEKPTRSLSGPDLDKKLLGYLSNNGPHTVADLKVVFPDLPANIDSVLGALADRRLLFRIPQEHSTELTYAYLFPMRS